MITLAEAEDFPALWSCLLEFHAEVGVAPLNVEKAQASVRWVLENGYVILAKSESAIIGTIGLTEQPFWYSDDTRLVNAWCWVRRDYRAGLGEPGPFTDMVTVAKTIAEDLHSQVELDVLSPDRQRGRVADKLGYVSVGKQIRFGNVAHVPLRQLRTEDHPIHGPRQADGAGEVRGAGSGDGPGGEDLHPAADK